MVHGGIDGYSRLPTYLHASTNNRADTVLSLFEQAVSEHGLPSRVRCDKGGENSDVAWYMLSLPNRGPGRGSIIAGVYEIDLTILNCFQSKNNLNRYTCLLQLLNTSSFQVFNILE